MKGGGALVVGFSLFGSARRQGVGGERPHAVRAARAAGLPARPDPDRHVDHDHRRQQGHRHPRRDRARSRHPDRHPDADGGRAEHEHGSDDLCAPRDVAERHRRRQRQRRHLEPLDEHPRRSGASRSRRCSAWRRRKLGVPGLRASRSTGASSRAAARPSPTASCVGGKLFNVQLTAEHRRRDDDAVRHRPRPGHRQAGEPVHGGRQVVPADRHPGEGERARTPTSRTSTSRGCCTGASSSLAAPARTRRSTTSRSASTRPRSATSRAPRSFRSATGSPSSPRRSTTRSRPPRS